MLKESQKIRQSPVENHRRWFTDDQFDLITWQTPAGNFSAFQLCANKTTREQALVWRQGEPLGHYLVDSGEPGPRRNLTPMMHPHPLSNLPQLITEFDARSAEIDQPVRTLVLTALQACLKTSITLVGDQSLGGVYLLRIFLSQPAELIFGRHRRGTPIPLASGEYIYIGSALNARGANSLANRLLRHATRRGDQTPHQIRSTLQAALSEAGLLGKLPAKKTVRWHIDYLLELPNAEITAVLAIRTSQKLENPLAELLAAFPETQPVSPGLGASDHPGYTHLFRLDAEEKWWDEVVGEWRAFNL